MSSVVVKSVDASAVRRAMDEYASRLLATRSEVDTIIVFGSFSTGTYVPGSDLDVFVILSESDKPVRDRIPELLPGAFPVGVDLFPFTRAEMEQLERSPLLAAARASTWRYTR